MQILTSMIVKRVQLAQIPMVDTIASVPMVTKPIPAENVTVSAFAFELLHVLYLYFITYFTSRSTRMPTGLLGTKW